MLGLQIKLSFLFLDFFAQWYLGGALSILEPPTASRIPPMFSLHWGLNQEPSVSQPRSLQAEHPPQLEFLFKFFLSRLNHRYNHTPHVSIFPVNDKSK